MKERPILFKGEMVRAILSDQKMQTRRIVKGVALNWLEAGYTPEFVASPDNDLCPQGKVGDLLWAKENWRIGAWDENTGTIAVDYLADNHARKEWLQVPDADLFQKYWEQSCEDCEKAGIEYDADGKYHWDAGQSPCRTRSSIFMPKFATRITLEITGIRIERLNDITRGDCMAEGCPFPNIARKTDPKQWYSSLWESINGAGSWNANPWVWVVEFKRIEVTP